MTGSMHLIDMVRKVFNQEWPAHVIGKGHQGQLNRFFN